MSFASLRNVGRMPPSAAKTKLGRKITNGSEELSDGLLHLPLRAVVRDEVLRPLVDPERAHVHEAPDARLPRREEEVAGSLAHDPLELLGLPLTDRDEVDDALHALDGRGEARGLGHVALDQLAAGELAASPPCADRGRGNGPACPARRRATTTWPPTNPVAPVTRIIPADHVTRAGLVKLRRRERSASPGTGVPEDERRRRRLREEADRRHELE